MRRISRPPLHTRLPRGRTNPGNPSTPSLFSNTRDAAALLRLPLPVFLLAVFLLASVILPACNGSENRVFHPPVEPEDALQTMELADSDLQIELFASEPLVSDPVAMEIDEHGRIYVVEMPGYPLDTSGSGRIVRLHDTSGDGLPDRSTVFADGLILPKGIMRWKEGLLVTDAPDLIYLEDTTGDGKADLRKTVLTGFARSNPQHNFNKPLYGLDNWIYLANRGIIRTEEYADRFGDEGGEVRFAGRPDGPVLPQNAGGRNVRLRPESFELEMLAGSSQFGHDFDAWGRHFLISNAHHHYHEAIAARYAGRNPELPSGPAVHYTPVHGNAAEVYPVTHNPEHQLLTDIGVMTSASSITWYLGGLFGQMYENVTFVAESVHNLVHADRVTTEGSAFEARRLFEGEEFLASTDAWFRPVNFAIGPDGALYVLDYYRRFIEHPQWMDEQTLETQDIYAGRDRGRIYRIAPADSTDPVWLDSVDLGQASSRVLAETLAHENIWWRRHAQRLLADRQDLSAVEPLEGLLRENTSDERRGRTAPETGRSANAESCEREEAERGEPGITEPKDRAVPEPGRSVNAENGSREKAETDSQLKSVERNWPAARLHALWTLDGLGSLETGLIRRALADAEPGVRENAIRLAEPRIQEDRSLLEDLLALEDDPSPRVRYQLLLTLGDFDETRLVEARNRLLFNDIEDRWFQVAALSAPSARDEELLERTIGELAGRRTDGRRDYFSRIGALIATGGNAEEIRRVIRRTAGRFDPESAWWQSAALEGLAGQIRRAEFDAARLTSERDLLLTAFFRPEEPAMRSAVLGMLEAIDLAADETAGQMALGRAETIATDEQAGDDYRADAIRLLGLAGPGGYKQMLFGLIDPSQPASVQRAALHLLAEMPGDEVGEFVLERWDAMTPAVRERAVDVLMTDRIRVTMLLDAIQDNRVLVSTVGWGRRVALMRNWDVEVRERARELLSQDPASRREAIAQYRQTLDLRGERERGRAVYERQCAACHQIGGERGVPFGPDLATVRHWTPQALMGKILDPNRAIADGYEMWIVERHSGGTLSGVVAEETPRSVTLRNAGGTETTIPRSDIRSITATNISAMPEGLEQQIDPQDMADLIEYIRRGGG